MNECFTVNFLGADSEREKLMWSLKGVPRNTPRMWGRQDWAERNRHLRRAAPEAPGQFHRELWNEDEPAVFPTEVWLVLLHQRHVGCSSAGLTLGQVVPSSWGQFPKRSTVMSHHGPCCQHLGMALLTRWRGLERMVQHCLQRRFSTVVSTTKSDSKL